jgi:Ser/Thr protein kinase RdoA (MazF antagonist)
MTLHELIADNYGIRPTALTLLDRHFGTEIYLAEASGKRYIVKALPPMAPNLEKEEPITRYLAQNGIPVARVLLARNSEGCVKTEQTQFHVQEFIEGKTFGVNAAPPWLMDGSARLLGKIHGALERYGEMDVNFGKGFFAPSNALGSKNYYEQQLAAAAEGENPLLICALKERIKHLGRISAFGIDTDELTYANSHGDFHIGQLIVSGHEITVVDWTGACKLPAALEVMTSYVYAAPECESGKISGDGLKRHIEQYSAHFRLNGYDIKRMPYLFYYQQIMCHYSPPYDSVPETYKPVCGLINRFASWLHEHAEDVEKALAQ